MGTRQLLGVVGAVVMSAVVACSAARQDEAVADDSANVTEQEFDRNAVLTDAVLRDSSSLSQADIQAFLDKTPWGHASVLAAYEENGKTAAEMLYIAAKKHDINPLELLVRLQMEQSLIYKKTASNEALSIAFGCGCPHSPVCSPAYEGFGNQAECAAGTLSRSMDRASTAQGTASGWKTGEEKETQDKVSIVPQNAATAALYTYTPWVGEAGGGKKGVGGASLHHQVWTKFASSIGYERGESTSRPPTDVVLEPSPSRTPDPGTGAGSRYDAGTQTPADPKPTDPNPTDPKPKPPSSYDAGGPSQGRTGESTGSKPKAGDDDADILSEGSETPLSDAPLPKSSGTKSRASNSSEDSSDPYWRRKPLADSGCSSSGSRTKSGDGTVLPAFLMAGALLVATRRRRTR